MQDQNATEKRQFGKQDNKNGMVWAEKWQILVQ